MLGGHQGSVWAFSGRLCCGAFVLLPLPLVLHGGLDVRHLGVDHLQHRVFKRLSYGVTNWQASSNIILAVKVVKFKLCTIKIKDLCTVVIPGHLLGVLGHFHQLQLVGGGDGILGSLAFSLGLFFQALDLNKHIHNVITMVSQFLKSNLRCELSN